MNDPQTSNVNRINAGTTGMPAVNPEDTLKQLNTSLRGEISAAETYRMAIEKITDSKSSAGAGLLHEIQKEHGRAAQTLRARIRELGGEASDSSGPWGAWATAVQGTMNLFGDTSALKALKEGEEHGLKEYQDGLRELDPTSAQLVQNQFIPAQQRHIQVLDQMINQAMHA